MTPTTQAQKSSEDRRAAEGAGLVSVGGVLANIIDLLLVVFLARTLDKTTFGLLAFAFMLQTTVRAIGSLGLPEALFYYVPKLGPRVERSMGLWSGALLFALAIPVSLLLGLGGSLVVSTFDLSQDSQLLLTYLAVYVLADFPSQVLPSFLLARRSYTTSFVVTLGFQGGRFASVVIPAALGASIEGILFWFVAVAWIRLAVYLVYFVLVVKGDLRREGWRRRDLFIFGAPMAASRIVGRLNRELDKYMVLWLFTPAIYGVYTVGAQEIPLVSSIAYSVTSALLPTLVIRFDEGDHTGFLRLWHGSMVKAASIMMPVFFSLMVVAGDLMVLVYGAGFAEAAIPFRVYLCLLPLRLCGYGAVVRALGQTRPVMLSAILALVVNAALNYPLFLAFGFAGPGMASVLAQLSAIVFLLMTIRMSLEISWREVFPLGSVARVMGVAGLAAIPLAALNLGMENPLIGVAAGLPLYVLSYLVLARMTGVISANDLRYLRDLVTFRTLKK